MEIKELFYLEARQYVSRRLRCVESDTFRSALKYKQSRVAHLGLFPYPPKPIFPEYLLPALVCYRGADEDVIRGSGSVGSGATGRRAGHVVAITAASVEIR